MLVRTLFVVLSLVSGLAAQDAGAGKVPGKANQRPAQEVVKAEPFDKSGVEEMAKCVTLKTEKGSIELEMFPDTAPNTVRNFLNLVAIGALNNTTFSRVVPEFVIQGGNLYSNPDISYEMKIRAQRNIPDEPNLVKHERGIISMARTDEPNSANTDFFILVRSDTGLDNKFAAFGRVVKGMDVVDEINSMPVDDETPKVPVVITSTKIGECVFEPFPAPKTNDLPRFGLRGKVKIVRVSSADSKGKNDVIGSNGWGYVHAAKELEFDETGHLIEIRYFDEKGVHLRTHTYTSMITGHGKPPEIHEFLKDAGGSLLREMFFISESSSSFSFKAYDAGQNLVGTGEMRINENGRVILETWERFAVNGAPVGKFTETITYDPYGFEDTIIRKDENTAKDSFTRYEYTEYDDKANWIERKVFDTKDPKAPVRTEKRVIVYFQ